MKRWGIYISLFVLMASVFGCTDERLVNDTSGEIKVTGTVDTPSRTSYAVGETAVSFLFSEGLVPVCAASVYVRTELPRRAS